MAAPTFQGNQVAAAAGTSTLTIATGAGNLDLATDDIIVAAGSHNNTNAGTLAAFGGTYTGSAWTELIADSDNNAPQMALRWSRATGTHSGETITQARIGASGNSAITAVSIRAALTSGSPIGGSAAQWFTSEPTDWTPGISTLANDAIVIFGILDVNTSANQLSAWTMAGNSMTERIDSGTAGRVATLAQTTAGAVGTFDATFGYASTTDRRFYAVTVESQLPGKGAPFITNYRRHRHLLNR